MYVAAIWPTKLLAMYGFSAALSGFLKNSGLSCCSLQLTQNSVFSSALSDSLKTPSFKEQKLKQKEVVGKSGRQPCIREVFAMDTAFICECEVVRYWIPLFIDNYLRKRSDIIVLVVHPTVALMRAQCLRRMNEKALCFGGAYTPWFEAINYTQIHEHSKCSTFSHCYNAFGMGLNRPNIRWVIPKVYPHYTPESTHVVLKMFPFLHTTTTKQSQLKMTSFWPYKTGGLEFTKTTSQQHGRVAQC